MGETRTIPSAENAGRDGLAARCGAAVHALADQLRGRGPSFSVAGQPRLQSLLRRVARTIPTRSVSGERAVTPRMKRVYDAPARSDGQRILVDRLWPRGLTKTAAQVDYWARSVAPSDQLRRWYGHDPEKWGEFQRRYRAELNENVTAWRNCAQSSRAGG